MSPSFLILGRPRSRTAWAANLLTVSPASHCLHEGLADTGTSLKRLAERMSMLHASVVGDADTGLIHYLDAIPEAFPEAKLVLMTGNDASWKRWCFQNGLPAEVRAKVDNDYARALKLLAGHAHFADCKAITSDPLAARSLWEYCVPNVPFDLPRWELLKDLNIQVIPESLGRRLRRSTDLGALRQLDPRPR